MEEFRPISLTSVVSKTVAKVIVNGLQLILPEVTSHAQSVFIKVWRYAIRVIGRVSEFFVPERGLRQGDPLSPYLFILCFEWLSYSLSQLHLNRSMAGIRISRRAPKVTHLMFADDCLLLFKVEERTAETLSSLLRKYESISEQVIKYNKSELVLSPKATEAMKSNFQQQFAVTIVKHHERYLGLPLSLKRKLTLNFTGILEKCWNKTHGWKAKNLSSGGQEILIKAVLQALPQYAMNCFLLPEYVINKMQSTIRSFWWSSSKDKKPIY
ncbi:hypothetical protein QQ045_006749 [Rhodiola kirilowii]